MKKMLKYVAFVSLLVLLAGGCVYGKKASGRYYVPETSVQPTTGFNQEDYIWEWLYFSTNRIDKVH